jgi:transcriptional regulator with XRE-family HTH domain
MKINLVMAFIHRTGVPITVTVFGSKLKKLRRERGWSQDQLAQEVGIHGRHVGKYEIGASMPHADTLIKIADVLGVTVDYLLREEADLQVTRRNLPLRNQDLLKKFEAVELMPQEDQQVIASLIDAYIKKQQIESILHQ